jgi:hypothetical protein
MNVSKQKKILNIDKELIMSNEADTMNVSDVVYYQGRFGRVLSLSEIFNGVKTLNLEDIDDDEITCTAKVDDCISMDSYWNGSAKSKSGIQY